MRVPEIRHYLLPSLLLLSVSSLALAQSAEELLKEINERKERINQFRALLNDPDQSTRLAALDVPTLRREQKPFAVFRGEQAE